VNTSAINLLMIIWLMWP